MTSESAPDASCRSDPAPTVELSAEWSRTMTVRSASVRVEASGESSFDSDSSARSLETRLGIAELSGTEGGRSESCGFVRDAIPGVERSAHELGVALQHVDEIGRHRRFREGVELRGIGHLADDHEEHVAHVARPGADERVEGAREGGEDSPPEDRRRVALEPAEERLGRPEPALAQPSRAPGVSFRVFHVPVDEMQQRAQAAQAERGVARGHDRGARFAADVDGDAARRKRGRFPRQDPLR